MQKNNMSFLKNLTTVADARTARASSWDQSGRNKDYWLVNAGDTAVMADVEGPGCINHIWVTTFCREILGPSIQHPVLSGSVAPVTEMENAEGVNWEINDPDYYPELTERYCDLQRKTVLPQLKKGLSALVYTQLTDVEDEVNGLFTYDRTAIKPDAAAVRAVNEALEAEFEKAVKA